MLLQQMEKLTAISPMSDMGGFWLALHIALLVISDDNFLLLHHDLEGVRLFH